MWQFLSGVQENVFTFTKGFTVRPHFSFLPVRSRAIGDNRKGQQNITGKDGIYHEN